ncbi:MAG: penicillin-binding transpeptidase domain-containing protein, partial [Rickettsiales bacterium]
MLIILISRLFYLQIINFTKYRNIAYKNRILIIPILPLRGNIFSKDKILLASNKKSYRLLLNKIKYIQNKNILNKIQQVLNLSNDKLIEMRKIIQNASYKSYGIIINNLSWSDILTIESNFNNADGLIIEVYYLRDYSESLMFCHIVGYAKFTDNEILSINEQENFYNLNNFNQTELYSELLPSKVKLQLGMCGAEMIYNDILKGKIGYTAIETDVYGNHIKQKETVSSINGTDIDLTIDAKMQKILFEELSENSCGIITNLKDNSLIAMVSKPGFDTNKLNNNISSLDWQEIINSNALLNKCIQGQYNPGSIFKLVTIMCALENGISSDFVVNCTSRPFLGEHFHCWYKPGHGAVKSMQDAIAKSCNHYMFTIAKILGIKNILNTAKKFGLGTKTNINLPFEKIGSLNNPNKNLATLLMLSIGQGFITATPIQLNKILCIIANGNYSIVNYVKNQKKLEQNKVNQANFNKSKSNEAQINQNTTELSKEELGIIFNENIKKNFEDINNVNKKLFTENNLNNFLNSKSKEDQIFKQEHLLILRQGLYQAVNLPF